MTKLRLAFASIEYPPDPLSSGIGTYTKTVATLLTKRGHKVFVVTRGHEEADTVTDEDGVTVYRLTPTRPALPETLGALSVVRLALTSLGDEWRYRRKVARTLNHLVEREHVDLIEAADHVAEPLFYRPKKHPNVPFVVRLHTPLAFSETVDKNVPELARRIVGQLERNLLQRATHLSAPSRGAAEAFSDLFGLGRSASVFPNPTSYEVRADVPRDAPTDAPSVLFAGRVTRWKGAHLLMKAVPLVLARAPNAHFVLAGSAHIPVQGFPSTQDYLLSLVPEMHRSHVNFLGHVPHEELMHLFEHATLCVFPSLFEAFGYTCLEAMALGKAVVGSRNGGMVDLLDGGEAGKLFTPPNVDELARHIVQLLQNPALRRELGERALKRARAHYASDIVITQTEAFYRQAITERQRADAEGNFTQN